MSPAESPRPASAAQADSRADDQPDEQPWLRLDHRVVAMWTITMAGTAVGAGVPTLIGIAGNNSWGIALAWVVPAAILLVAAGALGAWLYWRAVRYQVTEQRMQRRFSLVVRTRRSLARDRIRTVDLTANPLHRLLGLAALTIGTGQHHSRDGAQVKLDGLARMDAERLRGELLRHAAATADQPVSQEPIARLDWRWLAYAPVSFVAPALGAAAFGVVLRVSEWFGMQQGVISWTLQSLGALPLVVVMLIVLAAALVIGVLGSLALWVEMWWHYRLQREHGGTLRVQRGLLTTRSLSIEERRLRGVEVVEPIGNRVVGAARVDAVATGMRETRDQQQSHRKTLLPAAPRALAHRVAAQILAEPVSPTESVRLRGHPVGARGRRLRWAVGSGVVLAAVLVLLGVLLTEVLLHIAWISALVGLPIAVTLALEAYRNLGHGITGDYIVTRSGAMRRSTAALQRAGIIGWTAKQSIFQRRVGLITITATTAAGNGAYAAYDVDETAGLTFAEQAVPDLFTPFLERGER